MTAAVRIQSKEKGVWFDELPKLLSEAAEAYNLPETNDWHPLDEISSATLYQGIEVYGESAVISGKNLIAPATVYVELRYDPNSDDSVSFSDSYPASIYFEISEKNQKKTVTIQKIEVDNSSFFE